MRTVFLLDPCARVVSKICKEEATRLVSCGGAQRVKGDRAVMLTGRRVGSRARPMSYVSKEPVEDRAGNINGHVYAMRLKTFDRSIRF